MFYGKVFNDKNQKYTIEDVRRGVWFVNTDTIKSIPLPNLEEAIVYRNCIFMNGAIKFLLNTFKVPIIAHTHYLALTNYANKDNEKDIVELYKQDVKNAYMLIEYDLFSNDTQEFLEIKEEFINHYGENAKMAIFKFSELFNSTSIQENMLKMVETIKKGE